MITAGDAAEASVDPAAQDLRAGTPRGPEPEGDANPARKAGGGLLRRGLKRLAAAPAAEPIREAAAVADLYRYWRTRMFYSTFAGYALFYVCRLNFSVAKPRLLQLGYTKTELGLLGSAFYAVYAGGKFVNGMLCDRANPRYFMALGLLAASLCNLGFAVSPAAAAGLGRLTGASIPAVALLAAFWSLNGYAQSMGSPVGPKVFAFWFSVSERGTTYSLYNTCHNVGAVAALGAGGWLVQHAGWQAGFLVPGMVCAMGAFLLAERMRDRPESLGLPPVNEYRGERGLEDGPKAGHEARSETAWRTVLLDPRMWLLSLASGFIYVARYGLVDWAPTYLVEAKGTSLSAAGLQTSAIELLGIPGGILAGWASDRLFNGRRVPAAILCLAGLIASACALYLIPAGRPALDMAALGLCGFFVYGPQLLICGLAAMDIAGGRATGTAVGLTGAASYLGAMLSGAGSGWLADRFGWAGGFYLWAGSAAAAIALTIPLWNVRARKD